MLLSHFLLFSEHKIQRYERDAARLAKHVVRHWKRHVKRKKEGNPMVDPNHPSMAAVVKDAMHAHEATHLLGDG